MVIWDPILKASAGFSFHDELHLQINTLIKGKVNLLTPNLLEFERLFTDQSPQYLVDSLQSSILIKGGHQNGQEVCDELYSANAEVFRVKSQKIKKEKQKHGTGCILSSAITAELALGSSLQSACSKAHFYVKKIIGSNNSLLGYHHNLIN